MHGIITEDALEIYERLALERLLTTPTSFGVDAFNPQYGRAFIRFLLFQEWPDLVADLNLSECVLFYNRYLRACRFAKAYQTVHGPDDGLAQGVFKILEDAPSDVDWSILESIEIGASEPSQKERQSGQG